MLNYRLLAVILCVVAPLLIQRSAADDTKPPAPDVMKQLKQLQDKVAKLEARIAELEKKPCRLAPSTGKTLSQLEQRLRSQAAPTPPLRPLASNLMVDKNGIIWDQRLPVGIWGIDGSLY